MAHPAVFGNSFGAKIELPSRSSWLDVQFRSAHGQDVEVVDLSTLSGFLVTKGRQSLGCAPESDRSQDLTLEKIKVSLPSNFTTISNAVGLLA